MKNLFLFIFIFCAINIYSQDSIQVKTKIDEVTVYQSTAFIQRTGSKMIPKGRSVLKFENLTHKLVTETVQISCDDVTILGVSYSTSIPNIDSINAENKMLSNQILGLRDSIQFYKKKIEVLDEEESMILSNKMVSGDQGLDVQTLEANADFFRKRLADISLSRLNQENMIKAFKNELHKVGQNN